MEHIESLENLKQVVKPNQNYREKLFHIGNFDLKKEKTEKEEETLSMLEYLFNEVCPPLKYFTWGDFLEQRKKDKFTGFNGIQNQSSTYHYFLPHGYTAEVRPEKVTRGHAGMDMKNLEDYIDIRDIANWEVIEGTLDYTRYPKEWTNTSYSRYNKGEWRQVWFFNSSRLCSFRMF